MASPYKQRLERAQEAMDVLTAREWVKTLEKVLPEELADALLTRVCGHAGFDVWRSLSPWIAGQTDAEIRQLFERRRPVVIDYLRRKSVDLVRRYRLEQERKQCD